MVSSPSKFWRHILPTTTNASTFTVHGALETDFKKIANLFNLQFKSVFTRDVGIIPPYTKFDHLPPLKCVHLNEEEIINLLLNLDPRKSSAPDRLPNTFLKRYAELVAKYLIIIRRRIANQLQDGQN